VTLTNCARIHQGRQRAERSRPKCGQASWMGEERQGRGRDHGSRREGARRRYRGALTDAKRAENKAAVKSSLRAA
jgi:hypothetical protein